MQRIVCPERDDWRATAESAGFDFHTIDGERYWDERAYYAFTLEEMLKLRLIFPDGVCDYSKPGLNQDRLAGTYLTLPPFN